MFSLEKLENINLLTSKYKVRQANGTESSVKALKTHNLECKPSLFIMRSEKNPPKNTPKLPPTRESAKIHHPSWSSKSG